MCGVTIPSTIWQGGAMHETVSTHQPSSPFGCSIEWGTELGHLSIFPDSRTHICDRDTDHAGRHRCRCGATLTRNKESVS